MKIIYLFIALLISSISFSQSKNKGTVILDKVAKEYKTYKGAVIDFTLKMDNAQGDVHETSKGKAWAKGNMYKVNLMGVETYFDGTTKWSYMKDEEEVNVTTPDPNDKNSFNPTQLFTEYQNGYRVEYKKEMFENNRALQYVDLLPVQEKVKSSEFNRIKVKIDKDKNQIYQIIRYGKDGNDYTITINKLEKNNSLQDSMFKYDKTKNPDVEIIDLRD